MSKQQELEAKIHAEFAPHFLHIENESHRHSSGRGGESHFKIVLVSALFASMPKVARHRRIYQLLAADLQNGIHALALHTYSPSEWENLNCQIPPSTNCAGVGQ
ncbi:BolA family protein [Necropsobacter massiliensis]|uniref:BolA family protein n=1 Tax=Necropsobacter massiliensis TaxID=1400001 RepID=UPI000595DC81|nr:BolA/IbaG family iron-sulfur metabolism protein [Necropsobacter massiliensis]